MKKITKEVRSERIANLEDTIHDKKNALMCILEDIKDNKDWLKECHQNIKEAKRDIKRTKKDHKKLYKQLQKEIAATLAAKKKLKALRKVKAV